MESSCIYCGCACRLDYSIERGKITKVVGVKSDDISEGIPCIKGLTINEVYDKNRILTPQIMKNGVFVSVSLKEALDHIYAATSKFSPSEVFFNTSGKLTNEDNFVLQKFARVCYGTPNIDSCCGRLCHLATVMAMQDVFGTSNLTVMDNVKKSDCLLIIGSEPDKDYPVFYNKILKNKSIKIINVNPFVKSINPKDFVITIKPGSETCLLNGIVNELIKKGVKSKVEGFNVLKQRVALYDSDMVSSTCGLDVKNYKRMIDLIRKSKRFAIFHGMSITQHMNSLENVHSLLNLVLLKKGVVLSLRGEVNVQGAGDLGGIPGLLPTGDLSTKEDLERSWGRISDSKGLNMIEALMLSPVKAAFITEFDPFKTMPDTKRLITALKDTFIVYFGTHVNDTSKMANVIIPIASLLESEGTITNGERRVRKVNKVINGPKQLWEVLKEFSILFKRSEKFNYLSSKKIFEEIKDYVKAYNKIDVESLYKGSDAWADKTIKHERYMPEAFDGLDDSASKKYPFVLTTFRSKYSFLSNDVTRGSETLSKHREPAGFYFSKEDAKKLGLKNGDEVAVESQVNSLIGKAYISERIAKGVIGAYMHYSELKINTIFPLNFDEESFTPNFKAVAVSVKKVNI